MKKAVPIQKVSNWGNYPVAEAQIKAGASHATIKEYIWDSKEIIARGNGRCYGDASLGENIFSTRKLNKLIRFDDIDGIMECEAGVLLSEILEIVVLHGFFLYVTPGTKLITVGGAIASDVHGKNHHTEGCFSEFILDFTLMNEFGEILKCSREENSSLFWATIGGMGLTGIILSARFRLRKIETSYIRQEIIKAKNLDEIFDLFEESIHWTYTVAWIDCLRKGENMGRSVLFRGEHAKREELPSSQLKHPLQIKKKCIFTIPFFLPGFVLNKLSVMLFNSLYFRKQFRKVTKNLVDYETFFYPLDILNDWNRIYGKKGLIQYQMVIPKETGREGMRKILETISRSGQGSFLTVLKLFGKNNPLAYNSFPMEGYTLALDFKVSRRTKRLVDDLDAIVEELGGRIYLAKDSMSKPAVTDYLKNTGSSKFTSMQSKRMKSKSV